MRTIMMITAFSAVTVINAGIFIGGGVGILDWDLGDALVSHLNMVTTSTNSHTKLSFNVTSPDSKTDNGGLYYGAGAAIKATNELSVRVDVIFVPNLHHNIDATKLKTGNVVTGEHSTDNGAHTNGTVGTINTESAVAYTPKVLTTTLSKKPLSMLVTAGIFFSIDTSL